MLQNKDQKDDIKDDTSTEELRRTYMNTISQIDHVPMVKWYYYRDLMNDYDFARTGICPNRAFYKLWEILKKFPSMVPRRQHPNTCHLAEAPGSFIKVAQIVLDHPNSVAISKPRADGQHTPTFQKDLYKNRHVKLTYGNLLCEWDRTEFIKRFNNFDLVTADGGIDEKCFQDKEPMHHQLLFAEAITALQIQALNGNLVFKFFETFTETTLQILYFITQHYTNYTITKPLTSRPTNSERYLLCRGFKGLTTNKGLPATMNDLDHNISPNTRQFITRYNTNLIKNQIKAIQDTLDIINGKTPIDKDARLRIKNEAYIAFCQRFDLTNTV